MQDNFGDHLTHEYDASKASLVGRIHIPCPLLAHINIYIIA